MRYKEGDLILCVSDGDYGIVLSVDESESRAGNWRHYYITHWAQDGTQRLNGRAIDKQPDLFKLVSRTEI